MQTVLTYGEHGYNRQYLFSALVGLTREEGLAHHRVHRELGHPPPCEGGKSSLDMEDKKKQESKEYK
jgi:hypothetical protein